MKQILFFLLVAMALNANCEIFKCTDVNTGAIEYQSSPCASLTTKQGVVDIKPMNPQEEEQAQRKLQVWRDKQAADEKASMEAKKAK